MMKISIARMIANLATWGRALGGRFTWWSRWFPPAPTVDADRFREAGDPYSDHWKQLPHAWPPDKVIDPETLKAALTALPEPWRRVVILRDVEGRQPAEVSAATGLTPEQQRDVLNQARERLRQKLGGALEAQRGAS
jgi:DNA-directed RNA polymerase specialized sigma24 family protein